MKINAVGCSVVDNIYSPIDFNSKGYQNWIAEKDFEIGLITGGLVFGEDLVGASGTPYKDIVTQITGNKIIPEKSLGGPAIVALIHLAQVLNPSKHKFGFYGCRSNDENGLFIEKMLKSFDIQTSNYMITDGITPFTDVFSDPTFNDNNGERTFINFIGTANTIHGRELPVAFYDADMLIFGGTALTPGIHDDLGFMLRKANEKKIITCVNTIYDFRNEKKNPGKPWPLVSEDDELRFIDLLIMDNVEALKISGKTDKYQAMDWFADMGVSTVIITHGSEDIICYSNGNLFSKENLLTMPISFRARELIREKTTIGADTTGCGDNFAGGVYAALVKQLGNKTPSLKEAVAFGIVSGGFAGLYRGGVYIELSNEKKIIKLKQMLEAYSIQNGEAYNF